MAKNWFLKAKQNQYCKKSAMNSREAKKKKKKKKKLNYKKKLSMRGMYTKHGRIQIEGLHLKNKTKQEKHKTIPVKSGVWCVCVCVCNNYFFSMFQIQQMNFANHP